MFETKLLSCRDFPLNIHAMLHLCSQVMVSLVRTGTVSVCIHMGLPLCAVGDHIRDQNFSRNFTLFWWSHNTTLYLKYVGFIRTYIVYLKT